MTPATRPTDRVTPLAVVTGADKGLGRETVRRLLADGVTAADPTCFEFALTALAHPSSKADRRRRRARRLVHLRARSDRLVRAVHHPAVDRYAHGLTTGKGLAARHLRVALTVRATRH